ncbi:phosphoribosylaminoimidazolesuccinocarboxamide synthase [Sulfurivirga sp.]|uniref:phosphoribosylaminoimidazolesuccinocarboxamide synthase n=1 Tax=Sulfurivirga sp. TaxID=2614236 RepID=UPI0025F80206|nr:phosphoribosylaminoimidazolesuccinocarboxamide synthase [Sulfurivirga sp.]
MSAVFETHLTSLPLLARGKVRDIYDIDDDHMLIVTTDRMSAFDVILPTPIPNKGRILTEVAEFWFNRTRHIVPNHLAPEVDIAARLTPEERKQISRRSMVVKKLNPLPVEAIVRGYLIGSGWKEYQQSGQVCGIPLPEGLRKADRLPEPIFTPSTKAEVGDHDVNITFDEMKQLIGDELAEKVREISLRLYKEAAEYALKRGIIIADTKFEFGLDDDGQLYLIDEALTPDSSRFWSARDWQPGTDPKSFDKQYVRDYLDSLDWDKTPPGPELPEEVVKKTVEKYAEAKDRLIENPDD